MNGINISKTLLLSSFYRPWISSSYDRPENFRVKLISSSNLSMHASPFRWYKTNRKAVSILSQAWEEADEDEEGKVS